MNNISVKLAVHQADKISMGWQTVLKTGNLNWHKTEKD
jgi:hypothetical protein